MSLCLSNPTARLVFLSRQGLADPPGRRLGRLDLLSLVDRLGFVQVDSIQTVERAHHQILFSRAQTYRREDLVHLLERERGLFEHWTHDAALIPMRFYPVWKHRFRRRAPILLERWRRWRPEGFEEAVEGTYRRIVEEGALLSRDFEAPGHQGGGWWNWHPSKTALEFLWQTGRIAISRRDNFQKVYDLSERVIPQAHFEAEISETDFIDWCCREALSRLGFATSGEIAAFWDLVSPQEAKAWVEAHRSELVPVQAECVDGTARAAFALTDLETSLESLAPMPPRLRVLSPFDPVLRDRARAERLFGFFYRIEVFVPEAKRQYGYYVFPLMEGDRLVGRIDMKANRKQGTLEVKRLWWEPALRASAGRMERLEAELQRLVRFSGLERTSWLDGARAEP
ncbi:hypothetical protein BJF93_17795 [Xaviernesmea oryzae]|uniref:Winged helix-turn-helix domain-containing protein n=1 Tax=Xaviernesmea oryzae TaxID=464029 RepID=A0A1Q9ATB8_9HYPH|nr:winged helix-turn-helix domain-containing protein [Xaviernesmea oryzae]OLP58682.1 hypothetical protein BJF93_17795 [Xaviernesmea oryzae]SEK67600.1 hypothetical protein SAMN04487976_103267 [Xaviernesmea oryzae]